MKNYKIARFTFIPNLFTMYFEYKGIAIENAEPYGYGFAKNGVGVNFLVNNGVMLQTFLMF